MKLILSVLAITAVCALAVTGCSQGGQGDSAGAPVTNSSMANTNGMGGMDANAMATNAVPGVDTNTAATNSVPGVSTNMAANDRQ